MASGSKDLELLQKRMGLRFKKTQLLTLALTHSSYVHENKLPLEQCNERLEFLGDAVLGICIAEMLIHQFPLEAEGALSRRRAALVNQKQLAKIADKIELGKCLLLGRGEEKTGGRTKKSLLCDAFEALVGALYLDQGLKVVESYLKQLFEELIPESKKVETSQDYKTRLQEYHQRKHKRSPRYSVVKETGPDHLKIFDVKIEFSGKVLATGKGHSKREAEQDAAKNAFIQLGLLDAIPNQRSKRKRSKKQKPSKKKKKATT